MTLRQLSAELALVLRVLLRQPGFWVPTVLFPAMLYSFFGAGLAGQGPAAAYAMASFAVYAVLGVGFYQFGVTVAQDRADPFIRWQRLLPGSAFAPWAARVLAGIGFSALALLLVLTLGKVLGGVVLANTGAWGTACCRDPLRRAAGNADGHGAGRGGLGTGGGATGQSDLSAAGLFGRLVDAPTLVARCRGRPFGLDPDPRHGRTGLGRAGRPHAAAALSWRADLLDGAGRSHWHGRPVAPEQGALWLIRSGRAKTRLACPLPFLRALRRDPAEAGRAPG